MAAIIYLGPLLVDLDQVDGLGEHLAGVREHLDGLGPAEGLTGGDLGDGRVAAAFSEFVDTTARQHSRSEAELAALARATRSAATGYRQVDETFVNELQAGSEA